MAHLHIWCIEIVADCHPTDVCMGLRTQPEQYLLEQLVSVQVSQSSRLSLLSYFDYNADINTVYTLAHRVVRV